MGKGGRIACIFTPMALTIASIVCLALLEVAGWHKSTLPTYYFFKANLTDINPTGGSNEVLTTALNTAQNSLAKEYRIYLWNYCNSSTESTELKGCSDRTANFVFDPLDVWGFEIANSTANSTGLDDSSINDALNSAKDTIDNYENELLGKSGREAMDAYRKAAKWGFIAYQVSFWTSLATLLVGIAAIFSRWGSLLTWILALASSLFTFGAVLTSTVVFSVLVAALNNALKEYGITLHLGTQALVAGWLAVAFSWAATLFWLFSVCCCSGRSNPHHRSNRGGLWNAEPAHAAYGRGMQVEKTGGGGGGGYQRVSSPYVGNHDADTLPLQDYAQPVGYAHQQTGSHQQGVGYEPYRHA